VARRAVPTSQRTGPLRLRGELLRTLAELDRELESSLERSSLSPEAVHDLHRELRRLASGLTVWGRLLPLPREQESREVCRRVRRLARLVGRVRDRDVTTALLRPAARRPRNGELRAWREFLGRLDEDTRIGRELLRAFLSSERQGGLFVRAKALVDLEPRPDAAPGLHRILADERRRRQGRVRKAQRKARRDPTAERLHRLRIRIRQWRHLGSLELASGATAHHPPPISWRRLQEHLGRLHDLDVALATLPEELGDSAPARRLKDRRREIRRVVRVSLERIASGPERATARLRSPRRA
jgi:CHAD domain-containing protein